MLAISAEFHLFPKALRAVGSCLVDLWGCGGRPLWTERVVAQARRIAVYIRKNRMIREVTFELPTRDGGSWELGR